MPRGIMLALFIQRCHGQRNQPQRFARRIKPPPRKRQQPVIGKMRKIIPKRIRRIKVVFRQRKRPRRSRCPRIHQRRLNHLILVITPPHKAAPVFNINMNIRP